uniref:Srp40 C-terminal domain-containing protein n=2 Tax=Daucus carota subsp. sativus TaxID=79200 RepID=A0A162A1N6_DAUCS
MSKKSQPKTKNLTQEQKTCLLHSVVKYLENNALSKTLKRILSEAQIEGEEWKSSSVDLEDLYCKYLDTCNHVETTDNIINNQELQTEGNTKDTMSGGAVLDEIVKKKKKKRSETEKGAVAEQPDIVEKEVDNLKKKSEELSDVNDLIESAKVKGKKKDKKSSDFSNESERVQSLADTAVDENNKLTDKIKDKKKKKKSNKVDQEDKELMEVVVEEQSKDLSTAACDVANEKKSSKKRKRLVSDDNEIESNSKEADEEIKPKKAKGLEKTTKKGKSMVGGENEESAKENSPVAHIDSTKISKKIPDEHEVGDLENTKEVQLDHSNGNLEKSGYKSSNQKTSKKQHNGSAEPKTVNAFQRVKIDEVEFADEKLQDNSYWAKSGAEIGYGAKAQEVLGQVRGRDFRHEKTKKKRGSYRGGMIDLQSHSVKFNYSDED